MRFLIDTYIQTDASETVCRAHRPDCQPAHRSESTMNEYLEASHRPGAAAGPAGIGHNDPAWRRRCPVPDRLRLPPVKTSPPRSTARSYRASPTVGSATPLRSKSSSRRLKSSGGTPRMARLTFISCTNVGVSIAQPDYSSTVRIDDSGFRWPDGVEIVEHDGDEIRGRTPG